MYFKRENLDLVYSLNPDRQYSDCFEVNCSQGKNS